MGRIAILLWTLLAYGAHGAEPTVSTDTGRNKTTEDSTQISREKLSTCNEALRIVKLRL